MKFLNSLCVALLCNAGSASAQDAAPVRAGILMGVGDRISIVQQEAKVGSHLDRNQQQTARIAPETLQSEAVLMAAAALRASIPGVKPIEMPLRADVEALPWRVDGEQFVIDPVLANALERAKVSMLVVVEPLAARAELKLKDMTIGQGRLEGLGYYIDNETRVRNDETGATAVGYLAPFAYFRTLVVDVASMKVQCSRRTTASNTYLADSNAPGTHPWQALTAERKVSALREMLAGELGASLKQCLARDAAR
jgi:hypothetical protein